MRSAPRSRLRLGLLRIAGRALTPLAGSPSPDREPRRILLLRPDHIGDVLMTSPAVALLRASLPGAHLTYLVGPWSREVAQRGPAVDTVRTLVYPGFTRRNTTNPLEPYVTLVRAAARLRVERYDLAVVFRPDHWWGALLAAAATIPVRVGGLTPETSPLLSHARPARPREHAAVHALALARVALAAHGITPIEPQAIQAPIFRVSPTARAMAADLWTRHRLAGRTVVAVQPGAGAPLKSWPVERWAMVADGLSARGIAVALVGGPRDGRILADIEKHLARRAAVTISGQTLEVTAAIFERCAVLVGLDGGAAHLAAAVGTPTVRLYGPASADVYGPCPPRTDQRVLLATRLACVPCGNLEMPPCGARALPACLLALDAGDVLNAVGRQLAQV